MKIYVKIAGMFASAVLCFGMAHVASAHVIVHPSEAGVASYQTFDMSVPVEKDFPTVALKLLIPDGVTNISPTVKPGWTIDVKKDENGNATEIDWTGGSIPVGERDDFTFSGKVPAAATTLAWKAYQT
ncbi:MAG TPA: DUF1775 domain-containing protein, partial [Candidatus Paceibacterota bacterium]|nr:DUF1775 domain-containing protein [Candidatus Paceibacterota bacterium]